MKKLISSILILAMVLCCFISCNSNEIEGVSNSSTQVVQVKFDGKAKSMSVGTVYPEASSLYWAYTAVKQNGGGAQGQVEAPVALTAEDKAGFDKTITFSVGTWHFELYGFNTEDERKTAIDSKVVDLSHVCTYHAATTQTLKFSRNITSISLNAAPYSTAGYLNGKIKLEATSVGGNFVAYKIGDGDAWFTTDNNSVQSISCGPNTITLRLCEKGKNPSTEYLNESVLSNVTIYSGLTTTIGGTWDDPTTAAKFEITTGNPDTYCVVTFDPNYDGAAMIYQQVKKDSKTTAPTVEKRYGFVFKGWKDNTGVAFNPDANVTENKTYYAQWIQTRGFGVVSDSAGRPGNVCEWVQLWENGPKFATFNVGATIDDYAVVKGDTSTETSRKALYSLENTGGLYGWGGVLDNRVSSGSSYTYSKSTDYYKGTITTANGIVGTEYDTAKRLWGDNWQMLSSKDIEPINKKLHSNDNACVISYRYVTDNSVDAKYGNLNGTIIRGIGDYEDNEIFFPYTGGIIDANCSNDCGPYNQYCRYLLGDYNFDTGKPYALYTDASSFHSFSNSTGRGNDRSCSESVRAIYVGK